MTQPSEPHNSDPILSRIAGCLLGGAVGDALGAPVEFMKLAQIREQFGSAGVRDFAPAYGGIGRITDDTQMTLFTAEGLVRDYVRGADKGISHPPSVVHHAYLRWLLTQGVRTQAPCAELEGWPDGELIKQQELWSRRAPGNTCLTALGEAKALGEPAANNSKGCGTVMRVAPIGLLFPAVTADGRFPAFDLGVEISKLTHGHPTGYLAGGYFSQLIALLMSGMELRAAVLGALEPLSIHAEAAETRSAVEGAVQLADSGTEPCPEAVESLGEGWIAEEAVGIAVYCALVARDFEHGVLLGANISGDADSTASMAGQLLGAIGGDQAIPERWRQEVELRGVIEQLAADLDLVRAETFDVQAGRVRYPGCYGHFWKGRNPSGTFRLG